MVGKIPDGLDAHCWSLPSPHLTVVGKEMGNLTFTWGVSGCREKSGDSKGTGHMPPPTTVVADGSKWSKTEMIWAGRIGLVASDIVIGEPGTACWTCIYRADSSSLYVSTGDNTSPNNTGRVKECGLKTCKD